MVDEQDAHRTGGVGRDAVLAEPPGHHHAAADHRDHRPRAHRLDDRRLDLLLGARRRSGPRSRSASWASGVRTSRSQAQASELAVVSWPARTSVSSSSRSSLSVSASPSSVARLQQQREDVAALVEVGGAAARRDHRVGRAVEQRQPEPASARPASSRPMFISSPSCATGLVEAATRRLIICRRPCSGVPRSRLALDAEDPGHDHVEGDRLHPRRQREGLADRPAVDLAFGRRRRSSACSARSPRRGRAAAAACAGACGAGRPR